MKASTLWCVYSKLRTMIYLNHNVDISTFTKLNVYLRRQSAVHVTKKSKTFTKDDIEKFLLTANDSEYLLLKTVLIVGIAGGCRRDELVKLSVDGVNDSGEFVVININNDTETKVSRQFVITDGGFGKASLLAIFRKYVSRRNSKTPHRRFFVGYRSGKCTTQPVGINTFGAIPKKIATYLGLENCELYTGNCFRRSSAALLADSGTQFLVLKRHSGWKSSTVAEGYVQDSVANKCKIAKRFLGDDISTNTVATSMATDSTSRDSMADNIFGQNTSLTSAASASTSRDSVHTVISSQEVKITESSTVGERSVLGNKPVWPSMW